MIRDQLYIWIALGCVLVSSSCERRSGVGSPTTRSGAIEKLEVALTETDSRRAVAAEGTLHEAELEAYHRKMEEYDTAALRQIESFVGLQHGSQEKIKQLAELLDYNAYNGRISGSMLLFAWQGDSDQLRPVARLLYMMSSERFRRGQIDGDFQSRMLVVESLQLKELSPRLVEDFSYAPHFEWPAKWPDGWPRPEDQDVVDRGNIGRLARAVFTLGDPECCLKLRGEIADVDESSARVILWAVGFSQDRSNLEWLMSFAEQTRNEVLRNGAIITLNRLVDSYSSNFQGKFGPPPKEPFDEKAWRGRLQAKGWTRKLSVFDL